jgi:hypothetical protein
MKLKDFTLLAIIGSLILVIMNLIDFLFLFDIIDVTSDLFLPFNKVRFVFSFIASILIASFFIGLYKNQK